MCIAAQAPPVDFSSGPPDARYPRPMSDVTVPEPPPSVGGPSDPDLADLPPDPQHLVVILQDTAYKPVGDHLEIRGEGRWLRVGSRGAWVLTSEERVRIDADTVERLRGPSVWVDGRQIVSGPDRFELVPRDVAGVIWAILEPALAPTVVST